MAQTLVVIVLFIGTVAALPWLVRRIQQRNAGGTMGSGAASRVVSAVAIGPQQRVVTIEVGPEGARTWLVLGITAQQINCLHTLPIAPLASSVVHSGDDFAQLMVKTVAPDIQGKEANHV